MLKLAIMQPYLFPYMGYFQLIDTVDHFILYDDVNYMKGKWINRNRIIVNNRIHRFTVPLSKSSQNKLIREIQLLEDNTWKARLLKTIAFAYGRAPEFDKVFPLIEDIIMNDEQNLSAFIHHSLQALCAFMGIATIISCSSSLQNTCFDDRGEDRILNICLAEQATGYVNLCNGKDLYNRHRFVSRGIDLQFLSLQRGHLYRQFNGPFYADLSIIDVLMFNDQHNLQQLLAANILD